MCILYEYKLRNSYIDTYSFILWFKKYFYLFWHKFLWRMLKENEISNPHAGASFVYVPW
jgi:hypothetical protein